MLQIPILPFSRVAEQFCHRKSATDGTSPQVNDIFIEDADGKQIGTKEHKEQSYLFIGQEHLVILPQEEY